MRRNCPQAKTNIKEMGGRHSTAVAFALPTQPARVRFPALMLLGFNDSKCTAYTVDSASGLIVIQTHLVLAIGKLVLQKNIKEINS